MLSSDKIFRDRLTAMADRENTLRQEQWKLDQRQAGHQKCLGNPQECGVGIWKSGLRMSAWENLNAGRETRGHFSGHDPIGDAKKYKTRLEMQRAVFGQEYADRQQRASAIGVELDTIKTQREGEIAQHNAEQMAFIDKELAGEEAKLKRFELKAQHRGGHPESTGTVKPTSRRTKHGTVKRRRPIMQRRR